MQEPLRRLDVSFRFCEVGLQFGYECACGLGLGDGVKQLVLALECQQLYFGRLKPDHRALELCLGKNCLFLGNLSRELVHEAFALCKDRIVELL